MKKKNHLSHVTKLLNESDYVIATRKGVFPTRTKCKVQPRSICSHDDLCFVITGMHYASLVNRMNGRFPYKTRSELQTTPQFSAIDNLEYIAVYFTGTEIVK